MNTLLFILLNLINPINEGKVSKSFTLDSLGACQGITYHNNKVYAYGDREVGVIREYKFNTDTLIFTGLECQLSIGDKNVIKHPTGIAYKEGKTFIGNSVRSPENKNHWIAEIYLIDWDRLLSDKSLDNAVINRIEDDLAIQGTRPEYVKFNDNYYIATADYGNNRNEVRLYNPEQLAKASKTSEEGVLVTKFKCSPWVQNLHWIEKENTLVLVQNQIEGRKWRLTFLDLPASINIGEEQVLKVIDFDRQDELEGFCLLNDISVALATTSSRKENLHIIDIK